MRRRTWGAIALMALIVFGIPCALLGPYWLHDRAVDRVVVAVALDWRDFGIEAARERLAYELDRGDLLVYVGPDGCRLEQQEGVRDVHCAWRVEVMVPLTRWRVPLAFSSGARISLDGALQ